MLPWCSNSLVIDGPESQVEALLARMRDEHGGIDPSVVLPEPSSLDAQERERWRMSHWGTALFDVESWELTERREGHAHLIGLSQSMGPDQVVAFLACAHPELRLWFLTDVPDWEMASRECWIGGKSVSYSATSEDDYDAWFEEEDSLNLFG
jgi:hypothetical protein